MTQPLALSLLVCLVSLCPLQVVYADGLLPTPKQSNPMTSAAPLTPFQAAFPIQTRVTTQNVAINEEQAQDLITVTKAPVPLTSRLQKTYEAYQVTVQSDYPGSLRLQAASVNNAQSGAMAYELTKSSMTPVYMTLLLGLAGFVLIGVPVLIVKNGRNEKLHTEALPYTNQIPLIELTKGQTLTFKTLVPLGQKPDIALSFKDRQSGLIFSKRVI